MELSSHDFTCASSDPLSENDECNNVYNDDKKMAGLRKVMV